GMLDNNVIIITGAAGALGVAVSYKFVELGARVALVDRAADRLDQNCGTLKEKGALLIGSVDGTKAEDAESMATQVREHFGQIDGLVNIVGGFWSGTPVHESPEDRWDFMFNLNAKSTFLASKAVIPHLIENGGGKIVNIGAKGGLTAPANQGAYGASKSAVLRLTEAMSAELKDHLINVNAVIPSILDSEANRKAMPQADPDKWVTPDALADVIAFLCSDQARAIHGALIPVYNRN
ncbi:MAG: SDR family NAD(P)-dependent oxidoreductase, partial [Chloroflexi bacterium]|nr:SDR family NAD(P)-dependent oxidoreductase [Chloroflexota bacterium]